MQESGIIKEEEGTRVVTTAWQGPLPSNGQSLIKGAAL